MVRRLQLILFALIAAVGISFAQDTGGTMKFSVKAGETAKVVITGKFTADPTSSPYCLPFMYLSGSSDPLHSNGSGASNSGDGYYECNYAEKSTTLTFTLSAKSDAEYVLTNTPKNGTATYPATFTMKATNVSGIDVDGTTNDVASRLTTLDLTGCPTLTTLNPATLEKNCAQLTAVKFGNAQLKPLNALADGAKLVVTSGTTQTPTEKAITLSGESNTNYVNLSTALFGDKKYFAGSSATKANYTIKVLSPAGAYAEHKSQDPSSADYSKVCFRNQDGSFLTGDAKIQINFSEENPYYKTAVVLPITVSVPQFNYTINITETDETGAEVTPGVTAKLYDAKNKEIAANAKLEMGKVVTLALTKGEYDLLQSLETEGLTWNNETIDFTPSTLSYSFTVGAQQPVIKITAKKLEEPIPADPATAIVTMSKNVGGDVTVKNGNADAIGQSYKDNVSLTVKATPEDGYVVSKILFNGVEQKFTVATNRIATVSVKVTTETGTRKYNSVVVFFEQAAKVKKVPNADLATFDVTVGGATLDEAATYEVGKLIKITPVAKANIAIDKILVNGTEYKEGETKTVVGVNSIEVLTHSTLATSIQVIGGNATALQNAVTYKVSSTDITAYLSDLTSKNIAAGSKLTITFTKATLEAAKMKVDAVYLNGEALIQQSDTKSYTYEGVLAAGQNTVAIYSESTEVSISVNSTDEYNDAVTYTILNGTKVVKTFTSAKDLANYKEALDGQTLKIQFDKTKMEAALLAQTKVFVNSEELSASTTDAYTYTATLHSGQNVISIHSTSTEATIAFNSEAAFGDAVTYTVGDAQVQVADFATGKYLAGKELVIKIDKSKLGALNLEKTSIKVNGTELEEVATTETDVVKFVAVLVAGKNTVSIETTSTDATVSMNTDVAFEEGAVTYTIDGKTVTADQFATYSTTKDKVLVITFNTNKMDAQKLAQTSVYVNDTKIEGVAGNKKVTYTYKLLAGRNVISIHTTSTEATIAFNSEAAFGDAVTYTVGGVEVQVADFATGKYLAGKELVIQINKTKLGSLKLEETSILVNGTKLEEQTTGIKNVVQFVAVLVAGKNTVSIETTSTDATVSMNTDVAFEEGAVTYTIDGKTVTADQFATYSTTKDKVLVITFNTNKMDAQKLAQTSVYVNDTKIEGVAGNKKVTYTYKLLAGRNVISIHTTSTEATIEANYDQELTTGTVNYTIGNETITDKLGEKYLKGQKLVITIDKTKLYDQKLSLTSVYWNGKELTETSAGLYEVELVAGQNVITVHTVNVKAIVNLMPYDKEAGSVKYYYTGNVTANSGDEKEATEILYVKPTIKETTTYKFITVTQNNEVIEDTNNDGIYEIPLVSGNNNIYVAFSKSQAGSLKVILKGAKNEITNVVVSEKEGNKNYTMESDSTVIGLPTKTAVNISFKAPKTDSKNISVVLNAKAYTPTYNETLGRYEINDDIYLLSQSQSILRIDVKTLSTITLDAVATAQKTFVFDGKAHAPLFTTSVNGKQVYFDDFKYEFRDLASNQTIAEPTNVGSYRVIITRPADDQYVAFEAKIDYTITKAELKVVQVPTVSIKWTNQTAAANDEENWKGEYVLGTNGKVGFYTPSGYQTVNGEFILNNPLSYEETDARDQGYVVLTFKVDELDANYDNVEATDFEKEQFAAYYTISNSNGPDPDKRPEALLTISKDSKSEPFYATRSGSNKETVLIDPNNKVNVTFHAAGGTIKLFTTEEVVPGVTYAFYKINTNSATKIADYTGTAIEHSFTTSETIRLVKSDSREALELTSAAADQTATYSGAPQAYDYTKLKLSASNAMASDAVWTVTYAQNGVNISEPIDAGTYDVTIVRAADKKYKEFTATSHLIINKKQTSGIVIATPEATPVVEGAPLSTSELEGAAEIVGYYVWVEKNNIPSELGNGGNRQHVHFIPFDTKNYDSPINAGDTWVTILPSADVISWTADLGTITVTNANGVNIKNGATIVKGATYNVVATPLYEGKVEFKSMTITNAGQASTVTSSKASITAEGQVTIKAIFELKENKVIEHDTTIVPVYGNHIVNLPTAVRAAKVSAYGAQSVKHNDSFEFTVSTLDADSSKVVVRVDGDSIAPVSKGKYVISNITKDRTVTINVTDPTEVDFKVQVNHHSALGKETASVEVVNRTANDGKYYYNDDVQLIVFTETGIVFNRWSDGVTDKVREINLENAAYDLSLVLSGDLVGIESIGSAKVYGSTGAVVVKGADNAQVTITTFAGKTVNTRVVSGDAEIAVPAGNYIVTLKDAANTQLVKVVVK